ncbi:hypothetical protein FOIG_05884 [Fusarium odoratissimum NRRL 54006]|uniref:Uncharacterized protein n=2 Tax=Fusarium oxysporum species complex TaxID=171631 RepID=X0JNZ9_FUSO5|nr:uncharacterized protein FOIG_05884 [Fusarium odoratissimum NRRL 54006]EXM02928.1 hypothetical protein FOIG_05884 [Fusarium odoratissimum NRRL 54006]TXC11420.1 hypothetical protein FocTR4_00007130 [Fusarium oxysporum f. sp. cubense]
MANAEPLHGPSHVDEDQREQWGIFSAAASLSNAQAKTSSLFSSAEERNGPHHEQPWGPESRSGSGVAVYCTSERVRMKAVRVEWMSKLISRKAEEIEIHNGKR